VTLSPPGRAFLWAAVKGKQFAPLLGAGLFGWFALKRLLRKAPSD
jgi:hypothetical protein